jgi:hypothetical protein
MNLYQYCVLSEEEASALSAGAEKEDFLYQVHPNDKSQYSYSAMSASDSEHGYSQYDSDRFVLFFSSIL